MKGTIHCRQPIGEFGIKTAPVQVATSGRYPNDEEITNEWHNVRRKSKTRVKEMDCHALGNIKEEHRMGDNGPKWGKQATDSQTTMCRNERPARSPVMLVKINSLAIGKGEPKEGLVSPLFLLLPNKNVSIRSIGGT